MVARLSIEVVTTSMEGASSLSRPRSGRPDQPIGRKVALSTFEPGVGFSERVQLPQGIPCESGSEAHRMHREIEAQCLGDVELTREQCNTLRQRRLPMLPIPHTCFKSASRFSIALELLPAQLREQ